MRELSVHASRSTQGGRVLTAVVVMEVVREAEVVLEKAAATAAEAKAETVVTEAVGGGPAAAERATQTPIALSDRVENSHELRTITSLDLGW